jgi:hypothetical protein
MTLRRLEIFNQCMAGEYMHLHDEINQSVGRELLLSNGGLPPRTAPPEPPTLTPEEEKAMNEAMAQFREKD